MNALWGTRWWSWQRLVVLALTFMAMVLLFRKVGLPGVGQSLAQARPGWFAMAFCSYGLALVLGGLRWHVTLHAIRCAVHIGASLRLTFIGHFLFLILLGAAAGDIAKAALYARWFRFGVPELASSTPIDRVLGLFAAIAVGSVALAVGFAAGGFGNTTHANIRISTLWVAVVVAAAAGTLVALARWNPQSQTWWARGWQTLRGGIRNLASSPQQSANALFCAVGAQIAMAAVFALNVRAIAGESLPWIQMAWTFPVVMMLSCMPITVGGAGVREALSLAFLVPYGVPPAACVGAALLTFLCKVTWSLMGGLVFARKNRLQQSGAPAASVSVVIPVLNEADALPDALARLRRNEAISEIIVVDGGSRDGTAGIAQQLGCRVLVSAPGRGGQMRLGAAAATGDVVLLLHADTWLPSHAIRALLDCLRDGSVVAGGFWKEFREPPLLLLGSKWKCAVRLWMGRRIAGDQGMFVRRDVLERIGGVPDLPLMEEFALCRRLRQEGRLALADAVVLTSARRFRRLGVVRTYWRMWWVTMRYRFGTSPAELQRIYERS